MQYLSPRNQRRGRVRTYVIRFALLLLLVFISINTVAGLQVRSMTHFVPPNELPPAGETRSPIGQFWFTLSGQPIPRPENQETPANLGYDYETHTITLSGGEWLEAWWIAYPQPQGVVLLFPGYTASKEQLLQPAQIFHELGYSTFLVDFRGVGGSSGRVTSLGIREAEDVAYAVGYVRQTWPEQRVILYGTSMGSSALLRAVAREGVQPQAVIAEAPFARLSDAVDARVRSMRVPTFPASELLLFWGSMQLGVNAFTHNPAEYASDVICPTLLLRGTADARVAAAEIDAIYQGLPGPKARISVPHVGHELLLPQTPEVRQQVEQFLEQHAIRAPAHRAQSGARHFAPGAYWQLLPTPAQSSARSAPEITRHFFPAEQQQRLLQSLQGFHLPIFLLLLLCIRSRCNL